MRTVCKHCKEFLPIDEEESSKLRQVGLSATDLPQGVAYGAGCDECFHSGYAGRTAIYEFLPISETLRTSVMEGATASQIKREAIRSGMVTLREDGRQKILTGMTTTDEVLRVTQLDIE